MSFFVIDCEADGPVPGPYSMVCFGAVKVDESLKTTFYGETAPISETWKPDALAISGVSREEHLLFPKPADTMQRFAKWISDNTFERPVFISDNPSFDFAYINYYFHVFMGKNPFGYSGRRIGDLFCGFNKNLYYSWKKYRVTRHNHDPLCDAKGNAEALLYLLKEMKHPIPK